MSVITEFQFLQNPDSDDVADIAALEEEHKQLVGNTYTLEVNGEPVRAELNVRYEDGKLTEVRDRRKPVFFFLAEEGSRSSPELREGA